MCGVNPKVKPIADKLIKEVEENKQINLNDIKGYNVISKDYELELNKPLNSNYKKLDKIISSLSSLIIKDKNKFMGTLVIPEHINFNSVSEGSLLFHIGTKITKDFVNKTNVCGCYCYSFLKHRETSNPKLPKLKIISFFKK